MYEADAVKNTSSEELRKTWMPMWPRHGQDVPWFQHPRETTPARTLILSCAQAGGNVFKFDILPLLDSLSAHSERHVWIAMELIPTPTLYDM